MKSNKKAITKVFYKFLVDEGILFHFLERLSTTKYKTLEEHCKICKVSNYTRNVWCFGTGGTLTAKQWTELKLKWQNHIQNYYNQKK